MLRPRIAGLTSVRLILETGSRAGLQTQLHDGYYVVGRHKQCQIRPKSRSVSRRHCVIHQQDGSVRVRDLGSSAGTIINDRKLDPHIWESLDNGDRLRCGKVLFRVGIESGHANGGERSASNVDGEAWKRDDVEDLLDAIDDSDDDSDFDGGTLRTNIDDSAVVTPAKSESDEGTQVDLFEDAFEDEAVHLLPTTKKAVQNHPAKPRTRGSAAPRSPSEGTAKTPEPPGSETQADSRATSAPKPAKSLKKRRRRKSNLTARLSKTKSKEPKSLSGSSAWSMPALSVPDNTDGLKLIGAVLLFVCIVSYLGYTVYDLSSGPNVRVLQDID